MCACACVHETYVATYAAYVTFGAHFARSRLDTQSNFCARCLQSAAVDPSDSKDGKDVAGKKDTSSSKDTNTKASGNGNAASQKDASKSSSSSSGAAASKQTKARK